MTMADDDIHDNNEDIISKLPTEILVDILSRLPLKSAIVTGVLSHRWQCLWKKITSIDTDNCHLDDALLPISKRELNLQAMNNLIKQLTSPSINSFIVQLPCCCQLEMKELNDQLDSMLRLFCERNVERIRVEPENHGDRKDRYKRKAPILPPCILKAMSLFELDLGMDLNFHYVLPHGFDFVNLPSLKRICICIQIDLLTFKNLVKLISSCPSLQDFDCKCVQANNIIEGEDSQNLRISSTSLKRIILNWMIIYGDTTYNLYLETPLLESLTIKNFCKNSSNSKVGLDAPHLQSLAIDGFFGIDFLRTLNHLSDANLHIYTNSETNLQYKAIFEGISSVSSLNLTTWFMHSSHICFDALPRFINLTSMSWKIASHKLLNCIPLLLECCPVLITLSLFFSFHPEDNTFIWIPVKSSMSTEVNSIEINLVLRGCSKFNEHFTNFVKYILSNSPSLEQLLVSICYEDQCKECEEREESHLGEELCKFSRASSQCKIEIDGRIKQQL